MTINKEELIRKLKLTPHPEGGYFKETYRSKDKINGLPNIYAGERNYSTCIYFLLTSDSFSAFHRIKQDEVWHFYLGAPITIHMISEDGNYSEVTVGTNILNGELPQFVVPGGYWFGASVKEKQAYSLVGCTVSPGFDFQDFELPTRAWLLAKYPHLSDQILTLTHP